MGLFSRKSTGGRRADEEPGRARSDEAERDEDAGEDAGSWGRQDWNRTRAGEEPEAAPVAEAPRDPQTSEGSDMSDVSEVPPGDEAAEAPAPPRAAESDPPAAASADPIAAELRDLEERAVPERSPGAGDDGAPGGLGKDELRRAVRGGGEQSAADDEDEGRRSAADLMGPNPRRRHPFQPDVVEPPAERRMRVFAFANQKGGVAKTTTTLNLAVALSESGHRVLCVDLDPQGNLTMSQGIDPDTVERSLYHVLVERLPIKEIIEHREVDIAVASIDLAGAEIAMSTQIGRERSLQKALAAVADEYDFVCIDTPPSLGLLTINALTAADKVIVPVQCEYLSMRGLVQLQNTLEMIRENLNPDVQIEGILPTMLDTRTIHAKEAVEILEENFGELVFKSRIRKAIKFAEAPVKGSSVLKYDPRSNAAQCYRDLAEEVLTDGAT